MGESTNNKDPYNAFYYFEGATTTKHLGRGVEQMEDTTSRRNRLTMNCSIQAQLPVWGSPNAHLNTVLLVTSLGPRPSTGKRTAAGSHWFQPELLNGSGQSRLGLMACAVVQVGQDQCMSWQPKFELRR